MSNTYSTDLFNVYISLEKGRIHAFVYMYNVLYLYIVTAGYQIKPQTVHSKIFDKKLKDSEKLQVYKNATSSNLFFLIRELSGGNYIRLF